MANETAFIDKASILIGSADQGKKLITGVQNFKITDESTLEPVLDVTSRRPIGETEKKGAIMIAIEFKPRVVPDFDFERAKRTRERFTIVFAYGGGPKKGERWQYSGKVSKYDAPGVDNQGSASASADILVLGEGKRLSAGQP